MNLHFEKKKMFREAMLRRHKAPLSRRAAQKAERHMSFGVVILWLVFGGTLLYCLTFSPWLLITETQVEGESVVPREILVADLDENLTGKKFFFFSKRQQLVLSPSQLEKNWLERFPKFESVIVRRSFPHRLKIVVRERPYLIRWCSGGPCVLLDQGKTRPENFVDQAYYASYVMTLVDRSALPVTVGKELETSDYERTVTLLAENLGPMSRLTFDPVMETPSLSAHELRVKTTEGWDILVNTQTFSRETLDILDRTLRDKVPSEKRNLLLSIDMRTEGKVFLAYRMTTPKEGETIPALEQTQKQEGKKVPAKDSD